MTKFGRFWRELNNLHPFNLEGFEAGLNRFKQGRKTLLQVARDIVMSNRYFFTSDVSRYATEQPRSQRRFPGAGNEVGNRTVDFKRASKTEVVSIWIYSPTYHTIATSGPGVRPEQSNFTKPRNY